MLQMFVFQKGMAGHTDQRDKLERSILITQYDIYKPHVLCASVDVYHQSEHRSIEKAKTKKPKRDGPNEF